MVQEYARIFAALDGASTQEAVAQRAVTLAADNHAKLMFGHVIDSVPYEASGVDFEALCAEGKKRIEADLADVLAAARQNPDIPSVEVSVHAGAHRRHAGARADRAVRAEPRGVRRAAGCRTSSTCSWAACPRSSSATSAATCWW